MHALPLKTRKSLATLHVLSELTRVGIQFAPPLEYVEWLTQIQAGNETAIEGWLNDIDADRLQGTGFYPAFQELVYASKAEC